MARRVMSALAAAAAMSAVVSCGVETEPAPETSEEMILLAAETLDQTVIHDMPLLAAEEPPIDIDLSGLFGGAIGRPSISGGVDTTPTAGVGGPGRPGIGGGGVGEPSTGLGGVGSPTMLGNSSFAAAICDFVAALCEYFGRCGSEPFAVSECLGFAGSQCPTFVNAALAEAGVTQVPAEAVSWVNCAAQHIRSQSCSAEEEVFLEAFFACLPASLRNFPEPEPQPDTGF